MKHLFFILALSLGFVACDDDNDTIWAPVEDKPCVFVGELDVQPTETSPFEAFGEEDVIFSISEAEAAEEQDPSDADYINLFMPDIRFVSQMPVYIALEIRDIKEDSSLSDAQNFGFSLSKTTPYWNGEPYNPDMDGDGVGDNRYEITDLKGTYNYTTKRLSVEFYCYSMHVKYSGEWKSDSGEFDEVD